MFAESLKIAEAAGDEDKRRNIYESLPASESHRLNAAYANAILSNSKYFSTVQARFPPHIASRQALVKSER
jgi:hypothetical protein